MLSTQGEHVAVTNGKDFTIKLHCAVCWEHADFARCNPDCSLYCSTNTGWVSRNVYVCTVHLLRDIATNVVVAACLSHVLFCLVLVVAPARAPDADDPPLETAACGVESCSVSSAIFSEAPIRDDE